MMDVFAECTINQKSTCFKKEKEEDKTTMEMTTKLRNFHDYNRKKAISLIQQLMVSLCIIHIIVHLSFTPETWLKLFISTNILWKVAVFVVDFFSLDKTDVIVLLFECTKQLFKHSNDFDRFSFLFFIEKKRFHFTFLHHYYH